MKCNELHTADISLIIEMAWCDDTPFEAISLQFGLTEPEVIALMKQQLKSGSYKVWRERVKGRLAKHECRRLVMIRQSSLIAGSIPYED
ncbi:MAG: TIGR03643 family protein [Pseudomonadota bacterium]